MGNRVSVAAEEPLKARAVKNEATVHISRPDAPQEKAKKPGEKSENLKAPKFSFSLPKKPDKALQQPAEEITIDGVIRKRNASQPAHDKRMASIELPLSEDAGDGIISWEQWHRQFVENLYTRFHRANNGEFPGECRILIQVTRSGELSFSGGEELMQQNSDFQQTLKRSIKMLEHSPILEFPEGSQRQMVQFTMLVRSSPESGASSFGWQHGDYESRPKQ